MFYFHLVFGKHELNRHSCTWQSKMALIFQLSFLFFCIRVSVYPQTSIFVVELLVFICQGIQNEGSWLCKYNP